MKRNTIGSLLSKVEIWQGIDCWLWPGLLTKGGYAVVSYQGKMQCLHRIIYSYFKGPIPEGYELDHICRIRHCCYPEHLEPVTRQENQRRGKGTAPGTVAAAAKARAETHCRQGHEFTPENTRVNSIGRRRCRTCERIVESRRVRPKKERPRLEQCKRGHAFDAANTITEIKPNGTPHRRCRACHNYRQKERDRVRREQLLTFEFS